MDVVPEDFVLQSTSGRLVRRNRVKGGLPVGDSSSSDDEETMVGGGKSLPQGVIRFPEKTQEKLRIQSNFVIVGETDSYHPELVGATLPSLSEPPSLLVSFVGTPALLEGDLPDVSFDQATEEIVDQILGAIAGYASERQDVWLVSHGTSFTLSKKLGTAVNFRGWDMNSKRVTTIGIAPLRKIVGHSLIQQATNPDIDCFYGKFELSSEYDVILDKYFTDFLFFDGKEWNDEAFFRNNFESYYADKCSRVVLMIGGDRESLKYVLHKAREGNVMLIVLRSVGTSPPTKQFSNVVADAVDLYNQAMREKAMEIDATASDHALTRWHSLVNNDPELAEVAQYPNIKVFEPAVQTAAHVVAWIDDARKDSAWKRVHHVNDEDFWDFHLLLQERFFRNEIDKFGRAATTFVQNNAGRSTQRTTHTQYVIMNELNTNFEKANMVRAIMHQALWKLKPPEVLVHLAIGESDVSFLRLDAFHTAFGYGLLKAVMGRGFVLLDPERADKDGGSIPTALFDQLDSFKGVVPVIGLTDKADEFERLFDSSENVTRLMRMPSALRKVKSVNYFDRGKGATQLEHTKRLHQCASHMMMFKGVTSGATSKLTTKIKPHMLRKQLSNFVFELYRDTLNITVIVGNTLTDGGDVEPSPEKLSTVDDFVNQLALGYHHLWIVRGSGGIADYLAKLVSAIYGTAEQIAAMPLREARWVGIIRNHLDKVIVFDLDNLKPFDMHDAFLKIYEGSTTLDMCNKHYEDDGISELVRKLRETTISDEALLFARKEKILFGTFERPDRYGKEFRNIPAHYLRLPCFNRQRALKQIRNFILHNWNMAAPRVIISVVGDDEDHHSFIDSDANLRLPKNTTSKRLLDLFQRSLMRLCDDLQGCVFSSGWHSGVNKLLGQAISQGYYFNDVPLIGVSAWKQLERPDDILKQRLFSVNKLGPAAQAHAPDPHHTHFLFAVHNDDNEVLRFRNRIECVLEPRKQVLVVAGGGDRTLRMVRIKMELQIPIIVLDGSGGAADALALEYEHSRHTGTSRVEVPVHVQGDLQMLRKLIPSDLVQEHVAAGRMFRVDLASPRFQEDFETAALQALNEDRSAVASRDASALQATRVSNLSMKMTLSSIKLGLISRLDLSHNCLGDVAADLLAQVLEANQKIKEIRLSKNNITDQGCRYLGSGLVTNRSLETLWLDGNPITADGANELDCVIASRGLPIDFHGVGQGVAVQRELIAVIGDVVDATKRKVDINLSEDEADDIFEGLRSWPVHVLVHDPSLLEFFLNLLHKTMETRKSIGLLMEFKHRVDQLFLGFVTCPDSAGNTPLHLAVGLGITRSVELLVANIIDAHKTQAERQVLLTQHIAFGDAHVATTANLRPVLEVRGAHPLDTANEDGETPLLVAVRQGDLATTKCLVASGANFSDGTTDLPVSPFQWALENQRHFEERRNFLDAWGEIDDKQPYLDLADEIVEVMRSKVERATLHRSAFVGFCARFSLFGIFLTFLIYIALYSSTGFSEANLTLKQSMDARLLEQEFASSPGSQVLKTFWTIKSADEWWEWSNEVVADTFFPATDNSGTELNGTDTKYALRYNRLIGALRIRQLRVAAESCKDIPSHINEILPAACYPDFEEGSESKTSYGPGGVWTWNSESGLDGVSELGYKAHSQYPGSGFVVDIPTGNRTNAYDTLRYLRENKFVDKQTRTLVVEYLVYNANSRSFLSGTMMTEFFASGAVITTSRSVPIRFWAYYDWDERKSATDIVAMLAELYVFATGLLFALDEFLELRNGMTRFAERASRLRGWFAKLRFHLAVLFNHVTRHWNLIDYGGLTLLFIAIGLRLRGHSVMHDIADHRDFNGEEYINGIRLRRYQELEHEVISASVLLFVLKVVKYLCLLPVLGPFVMSIAYTVTDRRVFMFTIIFFWMIFAFSVSYLVSFGYQLELFDSYDFILTVLGIVFGEFSALEKTQRFKWFLAPIYWVAVLLILSLVMLNIFIALISEAYTENLRDAKKSYKHWETYVLQMKTFSFKQRFFANFAPAVSRFLFKDTNLNENCFGWSPPFWTEDTLERYRASTNSQSRDELMLMIQQLQEKLEVIPQPNADAHRKSKA